jgi:hypothetical protein
MDFHMFSLKNKLAITHVLQKLGVRAINFTNKHYEENQVVFTFRIDSNIIGYLDCKSQDRKSY